MQPKMCTKCKKNIAVVFITKVENGATMNEGYCLKCARSLGIPQIDAAVKQMGFSEEDLDTLSDEMSNIFAQQDGDDEELDSQTATFPLINQLFGASSDKPAIPEKEEQQQKEDAKSNKNKKHKFLDSYCMNLTGRAREDKLDKVIGRDVETERVIQILNRRQKNNPCLIGEPVTVSRGDEVYSGIAVGIDDLARLLVDCDDGIRRAFDSGEARARARAEN